MELAMNTSTNGASRENSTKEKCPIRPTSFLFHWNRVERF
jgi:hypothetical protein